MPVISAVFVVVLHGCVWVRAFVTSVHLCVCYECVWCVANEKINKGKKERKTDPREK